MHINIPFTVSAGGIIISLPFVKHFIRKLSSFRRRKNIYIHYLTKNWKKYDDKVTNIPIECIACHEHGGVEKTFDVSNYYTEDDMLKDFFKYFEDKYNQKTIWCHWNMKDENRFSICALLTRYKHLNLKRNQLDALSKIVSEIKHIDINSLIYEQNLAGWELLKKQSKGGMHALATTNNIGTDEFLTFIEEQKLPDHERQTLTASLTRKVKMIQAIHKKYLERELKFS